VTCQGQRKCESFTCQFCSGSSTLMVSSPYYQLWFLVSTIS